MEYVTPAARRTPGLVFLVAVFGKLRGRDAFREFRRSVPGLAPGLPPAATSAAVVTAESAAVVLLAFERTAPAGLVLAGAVLLAFAGGVHRPLRTGRSATCRCFGTGPAPVGRVHVVRNLPLTAVAWGGLGAHLTAPGQVHPAGAVIAVAAASVLTLIAVDGTAVTRAFFAGPTIVGLFSTTCVSCRERLPEFAERVRPVDAGRVLAVIEGDRDEAEPFVTALSPVATVVVEPVKGPVSSAFGHPASPSFYVVDEGAVVTASLLSPSGLPVPARA